MVSDTGESRSSNTESEAPSSERNVFQIAYDGGDDEIKSYISDQIQNAITGANLSDYLFVFLYDEWGNISNYHADRLYEAASDNASKNIFLFLHSNGGSIEPAYLIS